MNVVSVAPTAIVKLKTQKIKDSKKIEESYLQKTSMWSIFETTPNRRLL